MCNLGLILCIIPKTVATRPFTEIPDPWPTLQIHTAIPRETFPSGCNHEQMCHFLQTRQKEKAAGPWGTCAKDFSPSSEEESIRGDPLIPAPSLTWGLSGENGAMATVLQVGGKIKVTFFGKLSYLVKQSPSNRLAVLLHEKIEHILKTGFGYFMIFN